MRRKLLIAVAVLVICALGGITYIQRIALPRKLRAAIVDALEAQTGKKVLVGDAQFLLFRGVVLKDVRLYDDSGEIVSFKEGSFGFLIQPFFKKQIIIPAIKIKSAKVILKRNPDNTFNLTDLLVPKTISKDKNKFRLFVYKVSILNSQIEFQDYALSPPFTKTFREVNLVLRLALPAAVKFKIASEIEAQPATTITGWGEYTIPSRKLSATFAVKDFSIKELGVYAAARGVSSPEGLINIAAHLGFKDGLWEIDLESKNDDVVFEKDKIKVAMDSIIKASLNYSMHDRQWNYSGSVDFASMDIAGIGYVDRVEGVNGVVKFDTRGFYADTLKATLFGEPVVGRVSLTDFNDPALDIKINVSLPLTKLQALLKERFAVVSPVILEGEGKVFVSFYARQKSVAPPLIKGFVDVSGAQARHDKITPLVEDIHGRIEYAQDQVRWHNLAFKFLDTAYTSNGTVSHFQEPDIQLELASRELTLRSFLSVSNGIISIRNFSGKYLDSLFSARGTVALKNLPLFPAAISAVVECDLKNLSNFFVKSKVFLDKIRPSGLVRAKLTLSGNLNDSKSCAIEAKCSSRRLSAYGLHATHVFMGYSQHDGTGSVPYLRALLYGGTLAANVKMSMAATPIRYEVTAAADKINIAKLTIEAGPKAKELAGIIKADVRAYGTLNDLAAFYGSGSIRLKNGRFGELNLFKGLGSVLFTKDFFERIVFKEGGCDYRIKDKIVSSDNVLLKSDIAEIEGPVKIGFDNSLEGKLRVHILDEMVPLSGTFKDITTVIIGQSGIFGVIHASGTLKDPKFKFKPAIASIISGLKNFLFSK